MHACAEAKRATCLDMGSCLRNRSAAGCPGVERGRRRHCRCQPDEGCAVALEAHREQLFFSSICLFSTHDHRVKIGACATGANIELDTDYIERIYGRPGNVPNLASRL